MKTYLEMIKGERMVRKNFNPSGNEVIERAKGMAASIIDNFETMRIAKLTDAESIECNETKILKINEINCAFDYAQSYIQSASQSAVFGLTS